MIKLVIEFHCFEALYNPFEVQFVKGFIFTSYILETMIAFMGAPYQ